MAETKTAKTKTEKAAKPEKVRAPKQVKASTTIGIRCPEGTKASKLTALFVRIIEDGCLGLQASLSAEDQALATLLKTIEIGKPKATLAAAPAPTA